MATKFSVKDPNPGVWFKFNENDPDSGEIRIRVVNSAKRQEIQKACVKRRVEYKHGQRFEVQDTNDELFSELLWDYSIMEWNRLEDDDSKPIVCNTEMKVFLMQNNIGFAQFVSRCLELLTEEEESRVSAIEKNLSSGLSESKKSRTAQSAKI